MTNIIIIFMADITLTDQNFDEEVLKANTPVLVDFWATWCAPCRIVGPVIEDLAKEYEGRVKVGKVNVDQNPNSASRFGIMSIPSIVIFNKGQVIKSLVGAQGKDTYKKELDEILTA